MSKNIYKIVESWKNTDGKFMRTSEILAWIRELNASTFVDVKECSILESTFWFYDDYNGEILNRKRGFFSVKGMRLFQNDNFIKEQPMIIGHQHLCYYILHHHSHIHFQLIQKKLLIHFFTDNSVFIKRMAY